MANNVGASKMPLVEESSSSSSSDSFEDIMPIIMSSSDSSLSDGMSFVINDSDDEIILFVIQHFIQHQQDLQRLVFLLQLQQATQQLTPSASRPQAKKRCIKRDRELAHKHLYKDYFAKDPIYNDYHFRR